MTTDLTSEGYKTINKLNNFKDTISDSVEVIMQLQLKVLQLEKELKDKEFEFAAAHRDYIFLQKLYNEKKDESLIVECIDNGSGNILKITIGKKYEVLNENVIFNDMYTIIDDGGFRVAYFKSRFKIVKYVTYILRGTSGLTYGRKYKVIGIDSAHRMYKILNDNGDKVSHYINRFI